MSVVNCKVKFIREIGYVDLKEWINSNNNVYIGRKGIIFIDKQRFPPNSSKFCNIYKIGKDGTRDEVIKKYKSYMINKLESSSQLRKELLELKNKNLGCWCAPELCHGNILLELIELYSNRIDYFNDICVMCQKECNEKSGWKCILCNKIFCDQHNCEEYVCKCY